MWKDWIEALRDRAERAPHEQPGIRDIGKDPKGYVSGLYGDVRLRLKERDARTGSALLLLTALCMAVLLLFAGVFLAQLPDVDEMQARSLAEATIVYTADGQELTRYHIENRTWVGLEDVSPEAVHALIATEDHRFYRHSGVDLPRVFGAVLGTAAGETQGGSTLTMQLARNIFPEVRENGMLVRKVKEWLTALKIEDTYSKADILEMYLNTVPFLYDAAGIEAAARTYFQKPAADLTAPESATLIGLLKATSYYNPVKHPERSHARRNTVLLQMARRGYLDYAAYEEMKDQPTVLRFRRISRQENEAPFFAEYLRQWLDVWAEQHGYNLYVDGLRVYTTIDSGLQDAAEAAVQQVAGEMQRVVDVEWSSPAPFTARTAAAYQDAGGTAEPFAYFWATHRDYLEEVLQGTTAYASRTAGGMSPAEAMAEVQKDTVLVDSLKLLQQRLESGFVAMDPATGHVRAWVGGRDFRQREFDHVATARRQPGSTFKPFVYAAALENGYAPYSVLSDNVMQYRDPWTGEVWSPSNFGDVTGQLMTLGQALALSKNTITAKLITSIGPDKVVDVAHRMGIKSPLQAVPSLGLGTSEVTLLEMVTAYGTLANQGRRVEPVLVTRIEDKHGESIATFASERTEAVPAYTAQAVLDMMRGGVQYGTAVRIRSMFGASGDLAAKTGTTQNGADGWFMLIHPDLVMGAWMGFYSPSLTFRTQYWGQGAHNALHVVGTFYQNVRAKGLDALDPEATFAPPVAHNWETRFASEVDQLNRQERRSKNLDRILERIRRQ